ncbi:MAG: CDP-glucose 4,6-dehydratase [Hyphomicrobium sp.]
MPNREFWKGRRVLVTGHTGFKGAWLCHWLNELGADVTGIALPPAGDPNLFSLSLAGSRIRSKFVDIRDAGALDAAIKEASPEVVFHLAAQSLVRESYADPVGTYTTNVMGTVNVLEAVRGSSTIKAAVIVTSDKCYENREWLWAYRESDPVGGYDPYSSSKGCAELVASAYRRSFFSDTGASTCRIATARAGNVIGGGDWSADRLIPDIVRAISASTDLEIRHPEAIRPWQHVLEPLSGYLELAAALLGSRGRDFAEAWNFGPREEDCVSVRAVIETYAAHWGPGLRWHTSGNRHPHEAGFLKVDASKARTLLNWRPRLAINQAIEWTADWYKRYRDGEDPALLTIGQIRKFEQLSEV